jgi:hypothetical protein
MKKVIAAFLAVLMLALTWVGCNRPVSKDDGKKVIKLPGKAQNVVQFILSRNNDAVFYTAFLENSGQQAFLFRVADQKAQMLDSGGYLTPFRIGADRVGIVVGKRGNQELKVYSFARGLEKSYPIPKEWSDIGSACTGTERAVVCSMDQPGVTEDSSEINFLGPTAEGVVDLKDGVTRWFSIPDPSYYDYVRADQIYVSNQINENQNKLTVTIFDLKGKKLKTASDRKGTMLSHSGRYYLPQLHEGGLPWEIYETKTNKPIYAFTPDDGGRNEQYYGEWSPTDDDLLTIDIDESTKGAEFTTQVYSTSQRRVIRSFPKSKAGRVGGYAYAWSHDGKFLVFYRDGRFVFEPVMP